MGASDLVFVLLVAELIFATGLQLFATWRWSAGKSAGVYLASCFAIYATTFALLAIYSREQKGQPTLGALLVLALIPTGGWAALGLVLHFAGTVLRGRVRTARKAV